MDYNDNSLKEAVEKDNRFTEFFLNLGANMRDHPITEEQRWNDKDKNLLKHLEEKKTIIHNHFLNNFNTSGVILELDQLVSAVYIYMKDLPYRYPLLNTIADYMSYIFKVMGL